MRFIHLSDVRLGTAAETGRPWGGERRGEMVGTFEKVLKKAGEESVKLIIISGGLFSHEPVTSELEDLDSIFARYPGIRFVITAGRSDMIRGHSPVKSFKWAQNVHYVLSGTPERISLDSIDTDVYAASVREYDEFDIYALAASLKDAKTEGRINIAVCSESDKDKAAAAFSGTHWSYAALGGHSRHGEVIDGMVYYSGSLEPESMTEGGGHGILMGDAAPAGLLKAPEFVPMAAASYIPLLVTVKPATTEEELVSILEKKILERGSSNIYRIRISGKRDPERYFDLDSIARKYRISEMIDETEPVYDFSRLFEEHPQDLIGLYISAIRKNTHSLSPLEKKAMYYGIDALISTADDRQPCEGDGQ